MLQREVVVDVAVDDRRRTAATFRYFRAVGLVPEVRRLLAEEPDVARRTARRDRWPRRSLTTTR